MKDLFFILRMLGLTCLVVFVMNIHVGENRTLDDEFHHWLKSSIFVDYVQEAIDGGVALTKAGYKRADSGMHALLAKISHRHRKENRSFGFKLKRYYEHDEDDADVQADQPQASAHGIHVVH